MANNSEKRELVSKMFRQKRSAYYIHNVTGIAIKEVYHYLERCEQVKSAHKKAIYEQRLADRAMETA